MKTRHFAILAALAAVTPVTTVYAQEVRTGVAVAPPQTVLSPRDTTRATVGTAKVLIDYGRPSKRGREIFGEKTLVPYGNVWRTGANAATTFVTDKDLTIGGTAVPAGTYTLFTLPSATGWELIINKQTGQWGTEYDKAKDLARIPMKVSAIAQPVEKFTITVGTDAVMHLQWDTVDAAVPLAVK